MPVNVLLLATYEMGRQPFGLASPAAWLEKDGHEVRCLDLAIEELDTAAVKAAGLIAFHVPMHAATRLAARVSVRVREINPRAHLCFYGLYASQNERHLRELGAQTVLGGEFETSLVDLARRLECGRTPGPSTLPSVSLERQTFVVPRREGLPGLEKYARLELGGESRTVGYTEASRGCKHVCRHCPVVPVYGGSLRIVQRDVVLEDVRRQVAAGAGHVTFGDPDFFNGPGHAIEIVRRMHEEFPRLSYDVTIKIEHLLKHARHLRTLVETGCLFVTTAVESVDDRVLTILDKGHTRADLVEVVRTTREVGLGIQPTFVAFTPWLTTTGYVDLLRAVAELGLVDHVAPVQYAIRLLVTANSELLKLEDVRRLVGEYDPAGLVWPWTHSDPRVDRLHRRVLDTVHESRRRGDDRREVFRRVWQLALEACDHSTSETLDVAALAQAAPRATVPYLTEPWYC